MRRSHQTKGRAYTLPGQTIQNVRSRPQPAKTAVLRALAELIETTQYDEITVGQIIERAAVSRSTFYEHFSGKQDLLVSSIGGPFKTLADGILSFPQLNLVPLLEHFWSNRAFARGIFSGSIRQRAANVLVIQIETRLGRRQAEPRERYRLPRRLIAWQLAETTLGLIAAWLAGEARCSAAELADGLSRSSHAMLEAMRH
jgi:AcrR family transcriptional regulator